MTVEQVLEYLEILDGIMEKLGIYEPEPPKEVEDGQE